MKKLLYLVYDRAEFPVTILENVEEVRRFFEYSSNNTAYSSLSKHFKGEHNQWLYDKHQHAYKVYKIEE